MTDFTLQRLTIIIPTVARPAFVLRQFEYWRNTGPQVFILDGASDAIEIPNHLLADNVRYIHSGKKFHERLSTAGQFVNTEFCALLSDDEFFMLSGLRSAIKHLDKNKEVVGCVGRCLYFFVDQGRFLLSDAYRDWKPFPKHSMSLTERLEVDLPPNKVHMATYGVYRSSVWKKMFETSYKVWFSCGYVFERLTNLQRTVYGQTNILEDLLWMRSMENKPVQSVDIPRDSGRDFVSWSANPEFANEVADYRAIAKSILSEGGLSSAQVDEFEERFFVGGVHRQRTKEVRNSKKISHRVRKLLFTKPPKSLRMVAKRLLPNRMLRFTGWQGFGVESMSRSLTERGTEFKRNELNQIAQLALKSDTTQGTAHLVGRHR